MAQTVKNPPAMQETWIWSRSPGKGNGYPLQYSCLENSLDWRAWRAIAHGVTESLPRLSNFHFISLQNRFTGLTVPLIFLGCSFEIVPARCSHLNQDRNVYSPWQRFPSSQGRVPWDKPSEESASLWALCQLCCPCGGPRGVPGLPSLSALNWHGPSLSRAALQPRTTNQGLKTAHSQPATNEVEEEQNCEPTCPTSSQPHLPHLCSHLWGYLV